MNSWLTDLLVTTDFARTIKTSEDQYLDLFLRPVHWIAIGRRERNKQKNDKTVDCVVLSPHEANALLPLVRECKMVSLHVYSPRVSVSTRPFDDLCFAAVPAVEQCPLDPFHIRELNLFAGQLYLNSYEKYLSMCRLLGLCMRPPDEHTKVACDGFISPASRSECDSIMARECPFATSPVAFLSNLIAIRRNGKNFQKSHMGRILYGELLGQDQF